MTTPTEGAAPTTLLVVDDHAVRVVRAGAVSLAAVRETLGSTPLVSDD